MDRPKITDQQAADAIYRHATELLFTQHKSAAETIELLKQKGLDDSNAKLVVTTLQTRHTEKANTASFTGMLYGAVLCVVGSVASVVTQFTSTDEVHLILSYGTLVSGALLFFKGFTGRA